MLERQEDIVVVGEAADGVEAVEAAESLRPDVICMDIRMPNRDGIEATRRIVNGSAGTRVLILTTFDVDRYVYDALVAGAGGFLLKNAPPQPLLAAGPPTSAGGSPLPPPGGPTPPAKPPGH